MDGVEGGCYEHIPYDLFFVPVMSSGVPLSPQCVSWSERLRMAYDAERWTQRDWYRDRDFLRGT